MTSNESGNHKGLIILTGRSNPKLALDIGKILDVEICKPVSNFADGEIRVQIPHNLFKKDVFIIQPTSKPVNNSIMELLLMVDAVKRSSPSEITAVIPYFGYARQDRKELPRVPISSSVIANMLKTVGVDKIITLDIHSDQQQGFFEGPWENIYGSYVLVPAIKKMKIKNLVVASPDKGGVEMATAYAKRLNSKGIAIIYKQRDVDVNNISSALGMIGKVRGRNVLIVDDLIDTAGTLVNASKLFKKNGAKNIYIAVTHGVFSKNSLENISSSPIKKIFVTDTIYPKKKIIENRKIKYISVANMLAEVIKTSHKGRSLSDAGLID